MENLQKSENFSDSEKVVEKSKNFDTVRKSTKICKTLEECSQNDILFVVVLVLEKKKNLCSKAPLEKWVF